MISRDTSPEIERLQIELLRKAGPARRLELTAQLSAMVWKLSRQAMDRYHPNASAEERDQLFLSEVYGRELAEKFIAHRRNTLGPRFKAMFAADDFFEFILHVVRILEELCIPYELGCSLASSVHGIPRSTLDADIVADLRPNQVAAFVQRLGADFYADAQVIEQAVRTRKSFNIIHLGTMLKLDIFAIKDNAFARVEFSRRVQARFPDANGPLVWLSSPEDIILHKLMWYAEGGEVAARQFQDVLGVLRVAHDALDRQYLAQWSITLGVQPLWNALCWKRTRKPERF